MKKYQSFLSENFQFLEVKFSIYLNRHVFVMYRPSRTYEVVMTTQNPLLRRMVDVRPVLAGTQLL